MPRTPFDDEDEPLTGRFPGDEDEDEDEDEEGELDEDGEPFLPFDPADMETFYDWEQDFPELDYFDDIPDWDDSDFYD